MTKKSLNKGKRILTLLAMRGSVRRMMLLSWDEDDDFIVNIGCCFSDTTTATANTATTAVFEVEVVASNSLQLQHAEPSINRRSTMQQQQQQHQQPSQPPWHGMDYWIELKRTWFGWWREPDLKLNDLHLV